jgi:hypothetical protein
MTKQLEIVSDNIAKIAIKQIRTQAKIEDMEYLIAKIQNELSELDAKLSEYKI